MQSTQQALSPAPTNCTSGLPEEPNQEPEQVISDVSCERCRKRRVKCSRVVPRCQNCTTRGESCNLKSWKPRGAGEEAPRGRPPVAKRRKTIPVPKKKTAQPLAANSPPPPPQVVEKEQRPARNYDSDDSSNSPSVPPVPFVDTVTSLSQSKSNESPTTSSSDPSSSSFATRFTSTSPLDPTLLQPPPISLPPLSTVIQRRQPRLALCKSFLSGESSLSGLYSQTLDFNSLSSQLATNCPSTPSSTESSCIFSPSTSRSSSFPMPEEASQALSIYFGQVEPSFKLFPTNQSRQYLYEGAQKTWIGNIGSEGGGGGSLEWQGLYLATVASSAVVSSDNEFIGRARDWMKMASKIVVCDLRFASNPTLDSLRTLLLLLHTSLLGGQRNLNLPEPLVYLPILVSAAYKLDLNYDLTDINPQNDQIDLAEERRNLWWQVVKLETIWSTLLQTNHSTLDLSNSSTRLPSHSIPISIDPSSIFDPIQPISSLENVLRLISQLSKVVNSSIPLAPQGFQDFIRDLLACEWGISDGNGEGTLFKAMINYGILRLQAFSDETVGLSLLSDDDWTRIVRNLLKLAEKVSSCDMVDRLPTLLYVFQGATIALIRSSSFFTSQHSLRVSTSTLVRELAKTLRTTPWPAYMHQFIKRGVIVLEHLTNKINETATDFNLPMYPPPPDPSLSYTSPSSSANTRQSTQ